MVGAIQNSYSHLHIPLSFKKVFQEVATFGRAILILGTRSGVYGILDWGWHDMPGAISHIFDEAMCRSFERLSQAGHAI